MASERVRITISLSREVADQIDGVIDGVRIRNRSHAIETLVTESLNLSLVHQAVIFAGGETAMERLPAIRQILRLMQRYGVFEIIVAVGFLGSKVREELGNGESYGVKISYSESELGTGGALLQLKSKLKHTFLAINLSEPASFDLPNLLKFHRAHHQWVTVANRSPQEMSGVYVIEPKLLAHIPSGFCTLEENVFDDISHLGKLMTYPILTDQPA